MKFKDLKSLVFLIGVLLLPLISNAQLKKNIKYSGFFDTYYFKGPTIFTLGGGVNLYAGDVCGGFKCNEFNYNASFSAGYHVWPGVVFGGEFTYIKLGAKDEFASRNITFKTSMYELTAFGHYYLRRDIVRRHADMFKRPKVFKPYISLGVSGLVYNPTASYPDATTGETTTVDEGKTYPGVTVAFPAGLGVSWVISHRVRIMTEVIYRYALSDYIDGVGANFGSANSNDSDFAFNVKIAYAPFAPRLRKKKKKYSPPVDSTEGDDNSEGGSETSGGGAKKAKKATSNNTAPAVEEAPVEETETIEEEVPVEEVEDDGFEEDGASEEESFEDW
ncbi:MAG: hypothetical protein GY827_07100 [Cytophagales bacterium]|nr:hypothetical protein [Cytophagales bacterium]